MITRSERALAVDAPARSGDRAFAMRRSAALNLQLAEASRVLSACSLPSFNSGRPPPDWRSGFCETAAIHRNAVRVGQHVIAARPKISCAPLMADGLRLITSLKNHARRLPWNCGLAAICPARCDLPGLQRVVTPTLAVHVVVEKLVMRQARAIAQRC